MEAHIIQFSYLPQNDLASVEINGRWLKVPVWLWASLEIPNTELPNNRGWLPGGIPAIIREWQGGILMKYKAHPCEQEALHNIQQDAEALYDFYSRPQARKWYRWLSPTERLALNIERELTFTAPHLKGKAKFDEIASRLTRAERARTPYSWYQAQGILEDARDALVAELRLERVKKLKAQVLEWQALVSGDVAA